MDDFSENLCTIEGDVYKIKYGIDEYGEEIEYFEHVNSDIDYEYIHPEDIYY